MLVQRHWQALLQGQHWCPPDHWQGGYSAIHLSMRSYEALAKYVEWEDAKCAEYEKYAEYVKICKICRIRWIWTEKTFSVHKIRYLDKRPHFLESTDNTTASSSFSVFRIVRCPWLLFAAGLHFWRRCCTGSSPTDTIDSMPAAAHPNPEQFLPDLKRVSINKKGFNMAMDQRG